MIPQPHKWENPVSYHRRVANMSIPKGAKQHFTRTRCPHPKGAHGGTATIDLVAGCSGDKGAVINLAETIVADLMKQDRKLEAERVLRAVAAYVRS